MNLFWKIFVSFMIAMTVTSVGAIYVSFQLVSQPLTQTDFEGRDEIIREVSAALARGGERELKTWLCQQPAAGAAARCCSSRTSAATSCSAARCRASCASCCVLGRRGRRPDTPPNFRPMQLTPSITGPDQRGVSAAVRARAA